MGKKTHATALTPPRPRRGARAAFTLMEMLVAIALTGILLAGLAFVNHNVMTVWAAQAEDPLFDRHVDGLRRALEACAAETADAAGTQGVARPGSQVFSAAPSSTGVERAPYLRITGAPPFLVSDTMPMGFVHAWLCMENNAGLVLYWQTDAGRRDNQDATHRLVLSPWVVSMQTLSYDTSSDAWDDAGSDPDAVPPGASVFLQLTLNHRGQIRHILIPLSDNAPRNLSY
jgi:prepilin-type N-terminal cleavage/methylation domain-containing protein